MTLSVPFLATCAEMGTAEGPTTLIDTFHCVPALTGFGKPVMMKGRSPDDVEKLKIVDIYTISPTLSHLEYTKVPPDTDGVHVPFSCVIGDDTVPSAVTFSPAPTFTPPSVVVVAAGKVYVAGIVGRLVKSL